MRRGRRSERFQVVEELVNGRLRVFVNQRIWIAEGPLLGQQPHVAGVQESSPHDDDDTPVVFRTQEAAGRLDDPGESGNEVGVAEAVLVEFLVVTLEELTFEVVLREPWETTMTSDSILPG